MLWLLWNGKRAHRKASWQLAPVPKAGTEVVRNQPSWPRTRMRLMLTTTIYENVGRGWLAYLFSSCGFTFRKGKFGSCSFDFLLAYTRTGVFTGTGTGVGNEK